MKKITLALFLLISITLVFTGCNKKAIEKIVLDLYVMSQCPYGSQAESLVMEIREGFKDYVDFNVEYIATANADGTFSSLHGEPEVEGDIYQLCVKKNSPDKFWDYIACQNKNYQDLKSSFESCANENGIDYELLKACTKGDEGKGLLKTSAAKAKEVNASASPTFYLADELYTGPRTKIGLQRAFCEKLDNQPKVCKNLPEDKEFIAYLLTDSRCTKPECDVTRLKEQLNSTFSKIKYEELDYNTDEGKDFYTKYDLTFLPAILMENSVKEAENFSQVERYLKQVDDLFSLAIGAKFNPAKEICDNSIDDTGNGQVDCDDEDCNGFLECRAEQPKRLDLFVMSQCPYGTKALDTMEEVLDNFGNNIDFYVNYIANENPDGTFQSLHGQPEVDENIRELCAIEYYPNSYMDYIWCRNQDLTGDYGPCAADFPKITSCFKSSEGRELHAKNIKLGNELGIGASPTWLVNNRYKFSGIDAETVKTNFCRYNDIAGCSNTLSGQTAAGTASGSCN